MTSENPRIDPYLFERQFEAFRLFVKEHVNVPFVSFASHPYIEKHEGYKYEVHRAAREALAFQAWKESDIGSGEIITATIEAIEIRENNLVIWQNRFAKDGRHQQPLYEARDNPEKRQAMETCLFTLYHGTTDAESFDELVKLLGRKRYDLPAYLFFVKDRSRYLPIATTYFDTAFRLLGIDFVTSNRCSWDNYSDYVGLMGELKNMLVDALQNEVTLLDAHTFAWILSDQMRREKKLPNVQDYLNLNSTEREAIIKARIGQGQFRQSLIDYWSVCAVTGCSELKVLRASHIKPWSVSTLAERLSLYNGLLLSPDLDTCFDSGFLSFDDNGNILVSPQMSEDDLMALGIHRDMRLSKLEPEHKKYLAYHRENILK